MDNHRSDKPTDDDLHGRKLVERVLRDAVKRVVESGVEKFSEGPENLRNLVEGLKLPKDIASYLLLQIDETKNGLHRVVAKEIRSFLEKSSLSDELGKALSHLAIEIKTEIRFVPQAEDGTKRRSGRPEVKSSVQVKSDKPEHEPGSSR